MGDKTGKSIEIHIISAIELRAFFGAENQHRDRIKEQGLYFIVYSIVHQNTGKIIFSNRF
jgi:hypothetical protein